MAIAGRIAAEHDIEGKIQYSHNTILVEHENRVKQLLWYETAGAALENCPTWC